MGSYSNELKEYDFRICFHSGVILFFLAVIWFSVIKKAYVATAYAVGALSAGFILLFVAFIILELRKRWREKNDIP